MTANNENISSALENSCINHERKKLPPDRNEGVDFYS